MGKYPWYRLHLVTCLAIGGLGVVIAWLNVFEPIAMFASPNLFIFWPRSADTEPPTIRIQCCNVIECILLMLGVAVFLERLLRSAKLQFRLSRMFGVMCAVGVVLAYWIWERSIGLSWPDTYDKMHHFPLIYRAPPIWFTIYFAIGCTVDTAGWLTAHVVGWCFRVVRCRFRGGSEEQKVQHSP